MSCGIIGKGHTAFEKKINVAACKARIWCNCNYINFLFFGGGACYLLSQCCTYIHYDLLYMFSGRGKRITRRKPWQSWGEQANSRHKNPVGSQIELEPSCSEL